MRGNKKIIALAAIFALSLGSISNVSAVSYGTENSNAAVVEYKQVFSDVPKSHWAYSYVAEMYGRKVVNGFPDGKFYPSSTVTRAEFAKMMTTAAGIDVRNLGVITGFSDVPTTHWATQYIAAAKSYLSSYKNSNGTSSFRPDTAAVREDIAVAMVKLKGIDASGSDESVLKTMFSDYSSISSGARKYIAAAIENGIVSGYEDGTFKAQASITRAEAVAMMWRAFQYGSDSKQWEDDDKKQDSDVTMNQPIPPTFANKDDDNKKDDEDFNQPAAPTTSMGKQDKDDEDFNQPAIPTISMGKQDKDEDKNKDKSEKPVEKEPEENSDVYYVDTLDATFSGSMMVYTTFDENSNTVYWYNQSENVIKCMNADTREISNYLDLGYVGIFEDGTAAVVETVDEPVYCGIILDEIFYDAYEDKLIIKMTPSVLLDPNKLEPAEIRGRMHIYTFDGDEFTEIDEKFGTSEHYGELFESDIRYSNKDVFICDNGTLIMINRKTGDASGLYVYDEDAFVYNGDIYTITSSSAYGTTSKMNKINTSSGSRESEFVQDVGMSMGSVAKDSKFYIFDLDRHAIVSCDTNGKLRKEIDLSNLKVLDMLSVRFGSDHAGESGSIIVTDNMNIVYYDGTNKALRIIYKD